MPDRLSNPVLLHIPVLIHTIIPQAHRHAPGKDEFADFPPVKKTTVHVTTPD